MAADCQNIVRARVVETTVGRRRNIFSVEESLKGQLARGASITLETLAGQPAIYRDEVVLLFLNENKLSVLFRHKGRAGRSLIVLSRSPQAFCMDRSVLTNAKDIIEAVRAASKFPVDPVRGSISLLCNTATGTRMLVVPSDQRLEKLAHIWAASNSLEDRVVALRGLRSFKSDYNIALAQRFLADTRAQNTRGLGKWQNGFYAVRAEAHNLLAEWRVPHPQLPDVGPVYIYQPLSFSRASFIGVAGAILILVGLVLLRRRGHRLLVSWAIAAFSIAAILCLSLLWKRSNSTVDEVMFSIKDAHHELASYTGAIQYQVMREWTIPPRTVYGSFDLKLQDDIWSSTSLNTAITHQFAGFMSGYGQLPGPAGVIHPYKVFRLPYWFLVLPFIVVLLFQLQLLRRQLRRRRLGLCRNCGYDLRGSANGRCPECGAAAPASVKPAAAESAPQQLTA